jgi:hypothetical protein
MLNDLSRAPEGDFEMVPEPAGETDAARSSARFRASLWLGIAADIRRRRAAQETKGMVSC